jgi:hypothetical protein
VHYDTGFIKCEKFIFSIAAVVLQYYQYLSLGWYHMPHITLLLQMHHIMEWSDFGCHPA